MTSPTSVFANLPPAPYILRAGMLQQTIATAREIQVTEALMANPIIGPRMSDHAFQKERFELQIAELGQFLPADDIRRIILAFAMHVPRLPLNARLLPWQWVRFLEAVSCVGAIFRGDRYDEATIEACIADLMTAGQDRKFWLDRVMTYTELLALPLRRLPGWHEGEDQFPRS